MADKSKIEWTDATWNIVTGCTKVSPGCAHCYAKRNWPRLAANPKTRYYGRAFTDVATHEELLNQPMAWKKPRKIFPCATSDLFHPEVSDHFLDRAFAVMCVARHHTYQVLTKRVERMRDYLLSPGRALAIQRQVFDIYKTHPDIRASIECGQTPGMFNARGTRPADAKVYLPHVWIGTSVENQDTANERIPLLLEIPAAVRWLSVEPLLGPISFSWAKWHQYTFGDEKQPLDEFDGIHGIHWVVVGGESGSKGRPMDPDWARALRDQCQRAGITFMFKQWGEWSPNEDAKTLARTGKKASGRLLDAQLHDNFPQTGVRA